MLRRGGLLLAKLEHLLDERYHAVVTGYVGRVGKVDDTNFRSIVLFQLAGGVPVTSAMRMPMAPSAAGYAIASKMPTAIRLQSGSYRLFRVQAATTRSNNRLPPKRSATPAL